MRLLADENFPGKAITALRAAGHDVVWMRESKPGAPDEEVLELARSDKRILLTFDKDFGELCFVKQLPAPHGVMLFRKPSTPRAQTLVDFVMSSLATREDWEGFFSVVSVERIRWRPLK